MTFTWNALSATRPSANQPLGIHVVSYGLYLREIFRLVASGGLALPGQRFAQGSDPHQERRGLRGGLLESTTRMSRRRAELAALPCKG
jgi:hypothetical protein